MSGRRRTGDRDHLEDFRALQHAKAARGRRRSAGLLLLVPGAGWLARPRPLPRPVQVPNPTGLPAQDEAVSGAEEFDDSDPAHEPASFESPPKEPSPDRPSPLPPSRSIRATVLVVEAGFAAGRLAPPPRPRPTIVMLEDGALRRARRVSPSGDPAPHRWPDASHRTAAARGGSV